MKEQMHQFSANGLGRGRKSHNMQGTPPEGWGEQCNTEDAEVWRSDTAGPWSSEGEAHSGLISSGWTGAGDSRCVIPDVGSMACGCQCQPSTLLARP